MDFFFLHILNKKEFFSTIIYILHLKVCIVIALIESAPTIGTIWIR